MAPFTLAIVVWSLGHSVPPAALAGRQADPIVLKAGPHLLLDDHLIGSSRGVERRLSPPTKHEGNPIVTGKEDGNFQPYVTVVQDPQTKRYRIWYGTPIDASNSHLATMESLDGIQWIRPHKVLRDPAPIDFGAGVLDEGPGFADPSKRYKFAWWRNGGLNIAVSPDGYDWTPLRPGVILPHSHDINSIFWDPGRKRYVATISFYEEGPGWKGKRRVSKQATSTDLLTWTTPRYIITPDSRDEGETQFYCMGGLIARGDLLIGMVRVLRDDLPADVGGKVTGLGYTTLAWSRDGVTWVRDREPFLDRDRRTGVWDHAMAWADCQLPVGDEVFIYYGGYRQGHKMERFTERQIGLARMKRDRYVAREAGENPGTIETPVIVLDANQMTLNVDALRGSVRVQVNDSHGKPISGFRFSDFAPISGDHLRAPLKWKQSMTKLKGKPIRLQFELTRARLFAFDLQ